MDQPLTLEEVRVHLEGLPKQQKLDQITGLAFAGCLKEPVLSTILREVDDEGRQGGLR